MGSNNAESDVGSKSAREGAEAQTLSIDIPLSVNKINDATSLRRQSPSGAKPNFNKGTLIGRQIRWYHH
jgi:hypothetical protein